MVPAWGKNGERRKEGLIRFRVYHSLLFRVKVCGSFETEGMQTNVISSCLPACSRQLNKVWDDGMKTSQH